MCFLLLSVNMFYMSPCVLSIGTSNRRNANICKCMNLCKTIKEENGILVYNNIVASGTSQAKFPQLSLSSIVVDMCLMVQRKKYDK